MSIEREDWPYLDRIGMMLIGMPVDRPMIIEKNVRPENRDKFIECVKWFIDARMGHQHGWCIEFLDDYKKLRKI